MQTPGGSPIHHFTMRDRTEKSEKCPFCAKDMSMTKRQRNKYFTPKGVVAHIRDKHVLPMKPRKGTHE